MRTSSVLHIFPTELIWRVTRDRRPSKKRSSDLVKREKELASLYESFLNSYSQTPESNGNKSCTRVN